MAHTGPVEAFPQSVVDARPVTENKGLEHRGCFREVVLTGRVDQPGEAVPGTLDQPGHRRQDPAAVRLQFFRPHPGTAVNALEAHIPAIIESARVLKIAERPDSGREDQAVARCQRGFPHDRQSDTATNRLGSPIAVEAGNVQDHPGSAETERGLSGNGSVDAPISVVYVMNEVAGSMSGRHPRHHGQVSGGQGRHQRGPSRRLPPPQPGDQPDGSRQEKEQDRGNMPGHPLAQEDAGHQRQGQGNGRSIEVSIGKTHHRGHRLTSPPSGSWPWISGAGQTLPPLRAWPMSGSYGVMKTIP